MDREYSDRLLRTTSAAVASAKEPRAVLHAAFEAVVRGDFDAFAASVTDDVQLRIRGFGALDGWWRGRDDVVAATRKNFGLLDQQQPEIDGMIADGDRIAVLMRETGVFKSSGERYSVRGVQWFTFAGGKIREIDEIVANHPA
jgi:uncharacterized protein